MSGVADMSETGGEMRWPDETAVNTLERGDLLAPLQSFAVLDLHEQAELLSGFPGISGNPAEACCPCQARYLRPPSGV
jgi:hypothetical protein